MNSVLSKIIHTIYPSRCVFCRTYSENKQNLCDLCKTSLPWSVDRCYRCGLGLEKHTETILCDRCQTFPPHFDRLCSIFSYQPPVKALITGLKFSNRLDYGRVLSTLLAEGVNDWYYENGLPGLTLPEAIIPMPLHWKRHQRRGFNQAMELSREVERKFSLPVLIKECARITHTKAQARLSAHRRAANLQNAFRVQLQKPYQHVAIVDDVVTTGSTVNALSLALKQQGVLNIDVWCICRA